MHIATKPGHGLEILQRSHAATTSGQPPHGMLHAWQHVRPTHCTETPLPTVSVSRYSGIPLTSQSLPAFLPLPRPALAAPMCGLWNVLLQLRVPVHPQCHRCCPWLRRLHGGEGGGQAAAHPRCCYDDVLMSGGGVPLPLACISTRGRCRKRFRHLAWAWEAPAVLVAHLSSSYLPSKTMVVRTLDCRPAGAPPALLKPHAAPHPPRPFPHNPLSPPTTGRHPGLPAINLQVAFLVIIVLIYLLACRDEARRLNTSVFRAILNIVSDRVDDDPPLPPGATPARLYTSTRASPSSPHAVTVAVEVPPGPGYGGSYGHSGSYGHGVVGGSFGSQEGLPSPPGGPGRGHAAPAGSIVLGVQQMPSIPEASEGPGAGAAWTAGPHGRGEGAGGPPAEDGPQPATSTEGRWQ